MPSRKRTVEIEVVADTKKASADLRTIADNTTKTGKAFSSMGTLVKTGLAAFGAREAIDALRTMDQMNLKAEATEQRFNTVFGAMTDDAREWATEQKQAFGVGQVTMEAMAAAVQDLLVPMGFARDEAFGLTQEILTTANALSEWTGGTIDARDAQTRITKAMLGEREGLVELGIKLLDADVKARLAANGTDKLTGAALEQAKAQATLELILEKSADALASYTQRTGTAIEEQKRLQSQTEDAAFSFAQVLQPSIEAYKGLFADLATGMQFVSDGINKMSGGTKDFALQLGDFASPVTMAAAALEFFSQESDAAAEATEEGMKVAEDADRVLRNKLTPSIEATGDAADDAAGDFDTMSDAMLAAADPAFNLLRNQQRFVDAQRDYNEAVAEFGPESAQARTALAELAEAGGRYAASQEAYNQDAPEALANFEQLAREAGIYGDDLARILSFLRSISYIQTRLPSPSGGSPTFLGGRFHEGGVVPGTPGSDVPIMAQAGETIGRRAEAGGGGVGVIQLVLDRRIIAEVTRDEIVRLQRRNGTSGIT